MRACGSRRAVGGERAGARRHVPAVGVVGVDGDRPGVVAVAALVGRLPGLASVGAEGGATAARLKCRPGVRGCQASECTSGCAPGRWSCQLWPPSLERIRPPSSIPTRSRFASCGLGAIQRTCEVHGRGGKLQPAARAARAALRAPASSHRGRRFGTAGSARCPHTPPRRPRSRRARTHPARAARSPPSSPAIDGAAHAALAQTGIDSVRIGRVDGQALRPAARQGQLDRPGRRPTRRAGRCRRRSPRTGAPSPQPTNSLSGCCLTTIRGGETDARSSPAGPGSQGLTFLGAVATEAAAIGAA